MIEMLAQVAPQRSTQYTALASALAPYELTLITGGMRSGAVESIELGTQEYIKFSLENEPDEVFLQSLAHLAMTDAYFFYHEQIGEVAGPWLKPIELDGEPFLPPTLMEARRYTGKTNEMFTQFMCNLARYSSDFRNTPWDKITLLDPLCGGGTTLFVGLTLGADVAGVENDKRVVDGTIAFLRQYVKETRISTKFREDNLKNVGKRWFITVKGSARCVIGRGDTTDVRQFTNGLKRPQLIVTDLPYGIQHSEDWLEMLVTALPAWAKVLSDGGALVFSWNATCFHRGEMIELVQDVSDFTVMNHAPYNQLAHNVDRVIKQRDVIVARL